MAHLLLERSELIRGSQFESHFRVNELINNKENQCVVLLPDPQATVLNELDTKELKAQFGVSKELVVFVIDGLWTTVHKTMRLSSNLAVLPKICFEPQRASKYRIRKQPRKLCLSTIEAIYEVTEYLAPARNFSLEGNPHQCLLDLFEENVERQVGNLMLRGCGSFT